METPITPWWLQLLLALFWSTFLSTLILEYRLRKHWERQTAKPCPVCHLQTARLAPYFHVIKYRICEHGEY